jgi:hypothetical protein
VEPYLPNMLPWRGAQLKYRDNFTFTFTNVRYIDENSLLKYIIDTQICKFIFPIFLCLRKYIISYCNGSPVWGLGEGLITLHCKESASYETLHRASELAGSCEHDIEPSGSVKGREFLD